MVQTLHYGRYPTTGAWTCAAAALELRQLAMLSFLLLHAGSAGLRAARITRFLSRD